MTDEAPVTPCTCMAVRQAARQVTQLYDHHLAAFGLRISQYGILSTLDRRGPLSINELAARMVMDRTTMGRALRPLERDGLVVIAPGRDGRTRALQVTPLGRERLARARPGWQAAQAAFEARYGADEAAALRRQLGLAVAAARV